jgi:hypothetical protein
LSEVLPLSWAKNVHMITTSRGNQILSDEGEQVSEIKPRGAIADPTKLKTAKGKCLRLCKMKMTSAVTDELRDRKNLETLILIRCEYPTGWSIPFSALPQKRLVIFGANNSKVPADQFAAMSNSMISCLELVMADFMLDHKCLKNLRKMANLTTLNLMRTLTKEGVQALHADIDKLVAALLDIVALGRLRELNIAHCTAIPLSAIKSLAWALACNEGWLIVGGKTQLDMLGVRLART